MEEKSIKLESLRENINTTTATGRAFLSIMGAISQMERELRAERTAAGHEAAKALWDRFEFVFTPKHGSWFKHGRDRVERSDRAVP